MQKPRNFIEWTDSTQSRVECLEVKSLINILHNDGQNSLFELARKINLVKAPGAFERCVGDDRDQRVAVPYLVIKTLSPFVARNQTAFVAKRAMTILDEAFLKMDSELVIRILLLLVVDKDSHDCRSDPL